MLRPSTFPQRTSSSMSQPDPDPVRGRPRAGHAARTAADHEQVEVGHRVPALAAGAM